MTFLPALAGGLLVGPIWALINGVVTRALLFVLGLFGHLLGLLYLLSPARSWSLWVWGYGFIGLELLIMYAADSDEPSYPPDWPAYWGLVCGVALSLVGVLWLRHRHKSGGIWRPRPAHPTSPSRFNPRSTIEQQQWSIPGYGYGYGYGPPAPPFAATDPPTIPLYPPAPDCGGVPACFAVRTRPEASRRR